VVVAGIAGVGVSWTGIVVVGTAGVGVPWAADWVVVAEVTGVGVSWTEAAVAGVAGLDSMLGDGLEGAAALLTRTVTVVTPSVTVVVTSPDGEDAAAAEDAAAPLPEVEAAAPPAAAVLVAPEPVPRMPAAAALSKHPSSTPSVVFIGRAKQLALGAHSCVSSKAPLLHVRRLPATQATCVPAQAESTDKPEKTLLKRFARSRLEANACGETLVVVAGSV